MISVCVTSSPVSVHLSLTGVCTGVLKSNVIVLGGVGTDTSKEIRSQGQKNLSQLSSFKPFIGLCKIENR